MAVKYRDKVLELMREREEGKACYQRSDEILNELIERGITVQDIVDLGDGRRAQLVDNFADKNKVFRPHGIARFEMKLL